MIMGKASGYKVLLLYKYFVIMYSYMRHVTSNEGIQKIIDGLELNKSNPRLWNTIYEEKIREVAENTVLDGPVDRYVFDSKIDIDFRFTQLYRLDESRRVMESRIRVFVHWSDPRIGTVFPYNANLTGLSKKIGYVYVKQSKVWTPSIPIRNLVQKTEVLTGAAWVRIQPGGRMLEFSERFVHTACNFAVTPYPYDIQVCEYVFNGIYGVELGENTSISASKDKDEFFVPNSEWEIEDISASIENRNGVVRVRLRRHVTDAFFYFVLPGLIITTVSFLQFILPPHSGERTGVGVTCMLSMVVFLTMLEEKFSPDEHNLPRLAIYFALITMVITITLACSSFVILIDSYAQTKTNGPGKVTHRILGLLAVAVLYEDKCFPNKSVDRKGKLSSTRVHSVDCDEERPQANEVVHHCPPEVWISAGAILDRVFGLLSALLFLICSIVFLAPPLGTNAN